MTHIFDGREYARKKEEELAEKLRRMHLSKKPKLVSIIVGEDPASILYQNLKKKAAERIGAEVEIKILKNTVGLNDLTYLISTLNTDPDVNGIMVQLPLPANFDENDRDTVINTISPDKDIDGLRLDSRFVPPTAKAVMEIFSISEEWMQIKDYPGLIVVVGGSGFIGGQIVRELKKLNSNSFKIKSMNSSDFSKEELLKADVVISVTGQEGLIKREMVKENAVLIDVGSPKADIDKEAYGKASFYTPVPGGVGPVTIINLIENLVLALD